MTIDEVLAFTVWGDWAHYRRIYTTTSSLTYPFPPRTAIIGMISAILGYKRDSYYNIFTQENSLIALEILNPVKTKIINFNLVRTKEKNFMRISSKGGRSQIPMEFLKEPKWRIYLGIEDGERFETLLQMLKEHKSFYTLCLGISELIGNFTFEGTFLLKGKQIITNEDEVQIHSIIPRTKDISIKAEPSLKYRRVKVPAKMNNERVVLKFIEFFYEKNAKPVTLLRGEFYSIGDKIVIFF